jgi:periplasmic copper chaperone A
MNLRHAIAIAAIVFLPQWAHAQVTVSKPWVRATVPGQKVAAAASPAAKTAEIHEMNMDNGVMKMREWPRLELPAGKTVVLKPGGYHIMLVDIAKPLKAGDSVPITLTVESADKRRSTIEINAEVRDATKPAGSGEPMRMMH